MDTKICCHCERPKSLAEFNRKRNDYGSICKECNKEYQRQHYLQHKEKYLKSKRLYRKKTADTIAGIKAGAKCSECPENHPAVLEFHHRDEAQKEFDISSAVKLGCSPERLLEEIAKCDLLCSNCHKKKHWEMKHAPFVYVG